MSGKEKKSLDAKHKIFHATIDIIKADGMRGVRHRAVAALAGVSLGSTTYHFKSIEDLIISTFVYWNESVGLDNNPNFLTIQKHISLLPEKPLNHEKMVKLLVQDAEIYLKRQIFEGSDERCVELAFQHEALRSPMMSELLLNHWQSEIDQLAKLLQFLGANQPAEDAEIIFSLMLHLERKAMVFQNAQTLAIEFPKMMNVLKRQISLLMTDYHIA